ncbi:MAG: hypothetical protein IT314_07390 [Anaerolineales bacterium]|nr:hypothetical protein [Anaerolineales bacterium]
MKTEKTDYSNPPKSRGYRFWLTRLTILLGLPLLFYYGYCWGLWGRNSLLLQSLFQCSCPAASEEWRYPEYVDVLVPACRHFNSRLSPSGRLLYVQETESKSVATYLLNLETNEKTPFNLNDSGFFFLTDDLLLVIVHNGGDDYILDRTTGLQFPIQRFSSLRSSGYNNGLVEALHEAKFVFLLNDYGDTVVALSPDFPAFSDRNFYFNDSYIPGDAYDRLERFLKENNIAYVNIPFSFQNDVISPTGKLVAREDGVYSLETGQEVVEGIPLSSRRIWRVRGWIHDGSAAIYS